MRSVTFPALAALTLGLIACSEDTAPEPTPDPTRSPETIETETIETESFDPCALIPRERIEDLGLYRDTDAEQFVGLSLGTEQVVDCRIDIFENFTFGYKGVDDGREVWELVSRTSPEENPELRSIDDLGDEAYHVGSNDMDQRLVIQAGEHQLFIRDSTGSEVELDDLVELAQLMVQNLPEDLVHEPVVLPSACPAADDPVVTELIGEVVQARGVQDIGQLTLVCRYLGEGETRINAEIAALTPENAEDLIQHRAARSDEIDAGGRTVYVDGDGSDTSVSLASADEDGTYYGINIAALVDGEDYENDRGPDREAALDLIATLIASQN